MSDLLAGKYALVTGAASGIGAAIAEAFYAEGAQVIGVDVKPGATDVTLDISDYQAVAGFVDGLKRTPDILVNSAGICRTESFFDAKPQDFARILEVNVVGAFALLSAIAKRLEQEGKPGSLINIASNSGFMPKLEQLSYGASKAAMISMTRSAALSLGPLGIRVNAIAPGIIDTEMTQQIAQQRAKVRGTTPEATMEPTLKNLPLARIGTPQEVAQVAVFLASDMARYVTGQTYLVDGGQVMR